MDRCGFPWDAAPPKPTSAPPSASSRKPWPGCGSRIRSGNKRSTNNMYNKTVLDHFQSPRNLEEMKNPDAKGMGASKVCGDVMTLFLKIEGGAIKKATFTTMGCG